MANTNPSPNMNLPVPATGVDPGPDWANNLNASLSILDQHNHSSGSGVPITPAGLNINSDLSFNSNNIILPRSVRFNPNASPLSGASDLGCIYVAGVDLYYNDGNGNQIPITTGGSVAGSTGTITGLPSGTASASYGGGTFVFQSATSTSAVIDGGSLIMRLNTASSPGLTLSPPNALSGGSYGLVLPTIPANQSLLTIDNAGNIAPYSPVPITGGIIANGTITQSNLAVKTTGTTATAGNVAISAGTNTFTSTASSFVDITGTSITITTLGGPVWIGLTAQPLGGIVECYSTSQPTTVKLLNGSGTLAFFIIGVSTASPLTSQPFNGLLFIDTPAAGTYTYKLQAFVASGGSFTMQASCLVAYEL